MTSMINCPWCGHPMEKVVVHTLAGDKVIEHWYCENDFATFHNTGEIEAERQKQITNPTQRAVTLASMYRDHR